MVECTSTACISYPPTVEFVIRIKHHWKKNAREKINERHFPFLELKLPTDEQRFN